MASLRLETTTQQASKSDQTCSQQAQRAGLWCRQRRAAGSESCIVGAIQTLSGTVRRRDAEVNRETSDLGNANVVDRKCQTLRRCAHFLYVLHIEAESAELANVGASLQLIEGDSSDIGGTQGYASRGVEGDIAASSLQQTAPAAAPGCVHTDHNRDTAAAIVSSGHSADGSSNADVIAGKRK